MADFVSTLQEVKVGSYRWLFLLITLSDYASPIREEMNRQSLAFGADLRLSGLYVQGFDTAQRQIADEVLLKEWPEETRDRMTQAAEPVLIVIDTDWTAFDPRSDRWAIIWLSDVLPGREEIDLRPLLKMLATAAKRGDDVIAAIEHRASNARRGRLVRVAARAGSYIEWKPRVPVLGITVDLKALLSDTAE
jgi:hypothetical protein